MSWAQQQFNNIAAATLSHSAAPYLWSDPYLAPEAARMLRDHAGAWLDQLKTTPSVGELPARGWDEQNVAGAKDYRAINPYTWYHAWGGQGEGVRPRTVMGAFLTNAYLFIASADRRNARHSLVQGGSLLSAQAGSGDPGGGKAVGARHKRGSGWCHCVPKLAGAIRRP